MLNTKNEYEVLKIIPMIYSGKLKLMKTTLSVRFSRLNLSIFVSLNIGMILRNLKLRWWWRMCCKWRYFASFAAHIWFLQELEIIFQSSKLAEPWNHTTLIFSLYLTNLLTLLSPASNNLESAGLATTYACCAYFAGVGIANNLSGILLRELLYLFYKFYFYHLNKVTAIAL